MAISARGLVAQRGRFRLDVGTFAADASGTALLGHNGAGKSTLLLALQRLLPHEGVVERPNRCAGVFAQPAVLRGSALWNVAVIARSVIGLDTRTAFERAKRLLTEVGLGEVMSLDARDYSSGQRQRFALARALVIEPQALFLDEPFANVDADGRPALRSLVRDYVTQSRCALVLATQNLTDVATLCKTAMLLENGMPVELLDFTAIDGSGHPYLQALVTESSPVARTVNGRLEGQLSCRDASHGNVSLS